MQTFKKSKAKIYIRKANMSIISFNSCPEIYYAIKHNLHMLEDRMNEYDAGWDCDGG